MASGEPTLTVRVDLPRSAMTDEADEQSLGGELRRLWLIEQVRLGRLGVGKAAELSGVPRAEFMSMLGAHGVPVIDYPADELEHELRRMDHT